MIHERMTVNETMKSRHMLNVMFAFFVSFEGLKNRRRVYGHWKDRLEVRRPPFRSALDLLKRRRMPTRHKQDFARRHAQNTARAPRP